MSRRAAPHRGLEVRDDPAPAGVETPLSKTQKKRASAALQDLGEQLAALDEARLDALAMPEALREALAACRRTRSHEGRRRQLQYVGKLMRRATPEEHAGFRDALAQVQLGSARDTLALHEAERWRAEFIAGDAALGRWQLAHPACDAQRLHTLVLAARRDAAAGGAQPGRQPRSFRELFRFIRPHVEASVASEP